MGEIVSRTEKIKDGEAIMEEGTWAFYAYLLKSGKAKVYRTIDDQPVLIGTLNQGDIVGEIAFLGGGEADRLGDRGRRCRGRDDLERHLYGGSGATPCWSASKAEGHGH